MKIVSAHQPAYIPWLGYYHKILLSDEFVIMDDVQFEKNSFINRNQVLQNGKTVWLSIPVSTKNYKEKSIKEIEITDTKWKRKHLMTIEQSYKKSTYFNEIMPLVETTINTESKYLIDYTNTFLFESLNLMKINTPIRFSSELHIKSKKLDYVIELTKKIKGNLFVFGKQGEDYAENNVLLGNNIKPYFQNYNHPQYEQRAEKFVPYLSILDAFFNKGLNINDIILAKNDTKTSLL